MSEKEQIILIEEYKYCIVNGKIFTNPRGDAWNIFIINNYYIYMKPISVSFDMFYIQTQFTCVLHDCNLACI